MERDSKPSKAVLFYNQTVKLTKTFLLLMIVFLIFRLIFIFRFGQADELTSYRPDIFKAILTGFRFDAQVITYGLTPVLLLNVLLLFVNIKKVNNISSVILSAMFSIVGIALILDQQFYSFFQSHLNSMVFGIIDDDTTAVMKSVWTDHPVVRILLAIIVLIYFIIWSIKKIYYSNRYFLTTNKRLQLIFIFVFIIGFSYLIRGSFGEYPLQIDDSTVSDNAFINTVTVNGVYTLEKAIEEKSKTFKRCSDKELLSQYSYANLGEAFSDYYQQKASFFAPDKYSQYFFRRTKSNNLLDSMPPNVVVIVMESMSRHFLDYHSTSLNLMGRLEKHFNEDIVFKNCISASNWTIGTLEYLIINTPYQPITSTKYRFNSYESSVANTFKKAGYETSFIFGSKIGWRNMKEFIPKQYFDNTIGKSGILKKVKGARENYTWGVYDQYLFDYVFQGLEKAEKPQFMLVMSSTNHTPYEIPDDYIPFSLDISEIKKETVASEDIVKKALLAYQYANNSLGIFLDQIKSSELGRNTIVVVTGDHNTRALFSYDNSSNMMYKYGVPLYFYIPKKYMDNLPKIDTSLYTSHKDLFPTIFNLSLSNKDYFGFGDNLFDSTLHKTDFFGENSNYLAFQQDADTLKLKRKYNAISALKHYYFNQYFD